METIIKFRVWDEKTKKLYYTDTNYCDELKKHYTQEEWATLPKQFFIRLLDASGEELYEGDLLGLHTDNNLVIRYQPQAGRYLAYGKNGKYFEMNAIYGDEKGMRVKYMKAGNIFETSEQIK